MSWLSKYTADTGQGDDSSSGGSSWLSKYNSNALKSLNTPTPTIGGGISRGIEAGTVAQPSSAGPQESGFKSLARNIFGDIKTGLKKLPERVGIEGLNLVSSTADFAADFVARGIEDAVLRRPVGSEIKPSKKFVGKMLEFDQSRADDLADRWAGFYDKTLGAKTEEFKIFTQSLRERESIKPTKQWEDASLKDKFKPGHLAETVFYVGPGVIASLGAFAVSVPVGLAVSAGSVADDVKTLAIENGVDEDRANRLGLGAGLLIGAIDKLVPDELFGPQEKKVFMRGFIKRVLRIPLKEAGTEIVQENIQVAVESTFREDLGWDEVKTRSAMSGFGGFLGGSGAQMTVNFVNRVRTGDIGGKAEQAEPRKVITPEGLPESVIGKSITIRPDKTASFNLEVTEEMRGTGEGTKALKAIEARILDEGSTNVQIPVKEESVTFFEKQGYIVSGEAKAGITPMTKALTKEAVPEVSDEAETAETAESPEITIEKNTEELRKRPTRDEGPTTKKPAPEVKSKKAAAEAVKQESIKVPSTQLPVGEGKERISRLEARVKGRLDLLKTGDVETAKEKLGIATYNQLTRADQRTRAAEYVANNTEEAMRVMRGEIEPPKGLLNSAIYVALKELGAADTDVATQLATLSATRAGQEINYLQEIDPDNPVTMMESIVRTKIEAYEKRTGKKSEDRIKAEVKKITKEIKAPTRKDWDGFLESIKC